MAPLSDSNATSKYCFFDGLSREGNSRGKKVRENVELQRSFGELLAWKVSRRVFLFRFANQRAHQRSAFMIFVRPCKGFYSIVFKPSFWQRTSWVAVSCLELQIEFSADVNHFRSAVPRDEFVPSFDLRVNLYVPHGNQGHRRV